MSRDACSGRIAIVVGMDGLTPAFVAKQVSGMTAWPPLLVANRRSGYINGYQGGPAGFVARAHELAATYGERFEPPASLVEKAERGETYSDAPELVAAA